MSLEQYRQSKNLTQKQLADAVGVARSAVAMWEKGAALPRAGTLIKLAALFGCTVDELLAEAEEPTA